MDAELILLSEIGGMDDTFASGTREAILSPEIVPKHNDLKIKSRGRVIPWRCSLHCRRSFFEESRISPNPTGQSRVGSALILWIMTFRHVILTPKARCCCMRVDAGILGDWPTG
jgi:hypothetical protein